MVHRGTRLFIRHSRALFNPWAAFLEDLYSMSMKALQVVSLGGPTSLASVERRNAHRLGVGPHRYSSLAATADGRRLVVTAA